LEIASFNDKLLKEIKILIPNDINLKYNEKLYPKHQVLLSHLIRDYHEAYLKSFDNKKESRKNTLESLGKGNIKRKKRYENNKRLLENKSTSKELKLIALYENLILKRIIKGDYKFAYLLLTYFFMYQNQSIKAQKEIFLFVKNSNLVIDSLYKALEFFEFTFLSPSKIVNSCAISINQYIKIHLPEIREEERLKFVRSIINIHFSKHAPATIRADYFEREIYCAGLYNGTPIFQWHTSNINQSYYTQKDINKYFRIFNFRRSNYKTESKYITKRYLKKEYRHLAEEYFSNINLFETIIKNTVNHYVTQPNKLMKILIDNYKKTPKDYIKLPFKAINTIFVALITKLTIK
jgi:hypothetical protein